MSIRLVELAEIKRGSRVVDIATGIGEPAITAAKKVGSGLNGRRFGLMFLPNLKVGLINIYQSLLEGGHFTTAVWASLEKVPFIFVPMNTVLKETNSPPPSAGNAWTI